MSEATASAEQRPSSLWRNRDYLLLWGGQAVSATGSQASRLALPLLILAVTGSPAQAGLLGGMRGVAYLLFGLPAGALIDRRNRKWVLFQCNLVRGLAFATIPVALLLGRATAVQLYGVSFIEGTLFIFYGLAETASLVRVVRPAQLPAAIARDQATDAASTLLGPPLGGALFGMAQALPFVVDALSYAISAMSILFIRAPLQAQREQNQRPLLVEIREGVSWLRPRPALEHLLWLNGGVMLVYGGWPLLLIVLAQRLGAGPAAVGLIFAVGGAGTIAGALAIPLAQRWFGIGALVIGIGWIFALTWPPYALAPNLLLLGAVNCIGFFFVPIWSGAQLNYRLRLVSDELQGRVNSLFRLVSFGGQTLGFLLTGLLLQWRGPIATVWITFVPAIAIAALATLSGPLRGLWRLQNHPLS